MQVDILSATSRLSELIRLAVDGEDVVVAIGGKPVARIRAALDEGSDLPSGGAQTMLEWLQEHPLPAYARRSAAQIEATVSEMRDGWDGPGLDSRAE